MSELLIRVLQIWARLQTMEEISVITTVLLGILLVFGLMNCLLGYRLMRFWMMLGGFLTGCTAGFLLCRSMGIPDLKTILGAMLAAGVILAIVAFLIYRLGVFLIGAGLGLSISVYILRPTTSFLFFLCMLAGVILGMLAVRFSREIIIVGTSAFGGILAGFSLSRLGELSEIPYGIGISAGFALLGLLVQFAFNRSGRGDDSGELEDTEETEAEEPYDECDEEAYEEAYREMYGDQPVSHILNRRKKKTPESAASEEDLDEDVDEDSEEDPDEDMDEDSEEDLDEDLEEALGEDLDEDLEENLDEDVEKALDEDPEEAADEDLEEALGKVLDEVMEKDRVRSRGRKGMDMEEPEPTIIAPDISGRRRRNRK